MLLDRVKENIENNNLINKGDRLIVGVSGGCDSVVLLEILNQLKDFYQYKIIVAHVNHLLRGREADGDEEFVRNKATEMGLDFKVLRKDMEAKARKEKISEEEAGRLIRYGFFDSLAKECQGKIVTGHHLNDQVETFFINLFRGSGLKGLAGMDFSTNNIIRPILNIPREDLENFALKNNIGYREDYTNFQNHYRRNSIRNQLLPFIRENYNPNIDQRIFSTSQYLREEQEIIDYSIKNIGKDLIKIQRPGFFVLDKNKVLDLSHSLQKNLLRYMIQDLRGTISGFEASHIEEFLKILKSPTGKKVTINGLSLRTSYEDLVFEKEVKVKDDPIRVDINNNKTLYFNNWKIEFSIISASEPLKAKRFTSFFDLDKIPPYIEIRTRKAADRMRPLGMEGSKKVKDIFIDEKIDRNLRDSLPVFLANDKIIWLAGVRRSDYYKVGKSTKNILKIKVVEE